MGSWLSAGPLRTGEGGEAAGSVLEVRGGLQICAFESKEGRAFWVLAAQRGHEPGRVGASRDPPRRTASPCVAVSSLAPSPPSPFGGV